MRPGGLPELRDEQKAASDPGRHVWLEASAGTGKTQVLSARVFRLLLRDVEPSAILCLTFTKAGAAEMADRVHGRLARWVRLPTVELRQDLLALGEDPSDPKLIERARTRFAAVLDARGGGLRIQTIHSFAQTLLAAFPVEAGLVPGFRPLDAREEAVLQREALAELLVEEAANGGSAIADAIGQLSLRLGEGRAEAFLIACARAPDAMAALPAETGAWVRRALGLPQGDIAAELARCCGDDTFDCASLREVAAMNAAWGGKQGLARADAIAAWLAMGVEARVGGLAQLHSVWAKADGEMRSFGKGQAPQDARYGELAAALHGRCAELIAMMAGAAYADALGEALGAGRAYAGAYARAKARRGAVDFDDLIRKTIDLLRRPGMGDWVRFKLDQAIEHVLIDEAQDTNARQWAIVRSVAAEFFAGAGTRGEKTAVRTLFTVGDAKQAIFGFQGSDPAFFQAEFETYLRMNVRDLPPGMPRGEDDPELSRLSLTQSFRSTRPILRFVDSALKLLPAPGLGSELRDHASAVPGPGTVTLWQPTVTAEDESGEEEWVPDATRTLAADIARQVKRWWKDGLTLRDGRPLSPQDVMILVRRRGELASLLVARLYAEGVPVAGVDRLRLNAPLAVQDLLAAVRFVLQPEDDLSLAALLVSPLIGWTQDELMAAALREGGGLWRYLRATQPEERLRPLSELLARADLATPYAFLEHMLSGPMQGRAKLLARLGEEARDPIEELLTAALGFERVATPTLQQFLDWFDRGEVEIVRDPSQPLDAVRVMTAHGAKGLQAPVVILADAAADPDASPRDLLLWQHDDLPEKLPVFPPRKAELGAVLGGVAEAERARERQEHWRLFYVAATRAEERLVIAGAPPRGKVPETSWYALAERTMTELGVEAGDGARTFVGTEAAVPPKRKPAPQEAMGELALLPAFLSRPAPEEARPPRPLAPSSLGEDATADPPPGPAARDAAERGRLIHALLERLPALPAAERGLAAEKWLASAGAVTDPTARREIAGAALGVLGDARFAALFERRALAEAPVAATLPDGTVVSGTVDRLLVTDDRVLVVDFKTGRRVPESAEAIPPYHLRQMAAYVAALAVIFPDRVVEAALVYTAGPVLWPLSPALLARHKPGFAPVEQS